VRDALNAATAVMSVRCVDMEKLQGQLLDTMAEMWLQAEELSNSLRPLLGNRTFTIPYSHLIHITITP
jgi:hypothetical protein